MNSNALHRLAHWWDPTDCRCQIGTWMAGWKARRDMELRQLATPKNPDDLDKWLRSLIADSEQEVA